MEKAAKWGKNIKLCFQFKDVIWNLLSFRNFVYSTIEIQTQFEAEVPQRINEQP